MTGIGVGFAGWAVLNLLLLAQLVLTLLNWRSAPRLEREGERGPGGGSAAQAPRVSLLIPARNEAVNLREHLEGWLASDWPQLEVRVLDDHSDDATPATLAEAAARHPGRLHVLRGEPLPPGWLGKNWACHQLAREARGEILIFADADVAVSPRAVPRTVRAMTEWRADALTALPRQRLETSAERAVVPLVMHVPVLGFLPLALVPFWRSQSALVANGQWLAWRREAYDAVGGHAAVRADLAEDMALGRALKARGLRLLSILAVDDLRVRMYRSSSELREGFGKNLYLLLGGHPLAFAALWTTLAALWLGPWLGALWPAPLAPAWRLAWGFSLGALLLARIAAAATFRAPPASVAWHPVGAALTLGIALESAWRHARGRVRWKGRTLPAGSAPVK